ncbi:MAG: DNA polymerase III subunit alpha [Rhodothermales bacterium]|nr:DNA polymerase III subunit alpha [Rhodothermales bacterium]MBO6780706.1 DNA polymerase III subunit alpha [Rhodothermales bacterium]
MADFCHLHCHTQYSLLDGAARIERLVASAAEMEMPALAITDHGNLFGVPEFYTKARRAGVKPIIGCEFYVTPSGMDDRSDRTRYHQVLLARNEEGYRNLIRLSSLSYTDGYYYKPRLDLEAIRAHSGGLVATTCCLQGHVPQMILKQGEAAARPVFETYLEIFGKDYLIEIQDHGIEDQHRANAVLLKWAREYDVKVVATNDVHYVEREDHAAQDVLLCLQTGKDLYDPNRMRFENDQFFLKTSAQMEAALGSLEPDQRTQSLVTTLEVADRCDLELEMGKLLMPHYPLPEQFGGDMDGYLRHLVYERARSRYGELTQAVTERLDLELGIIRDMGYAGYFLIVQDFTTAARDLGVSVGPGRGSAAGSAVAYCLGITNIDPLEYDLLFERFLNPERVSMPDIDIDFDDRGRSKVIDYVVQKYGRQNVCQIITFGTMGARSVIRDVSRVLGVPLPEADRIAKMIPEGPGQSLASAIKDVPEFRRLLTDQNEQIRNLMHYSQVLEGSARHTGVHAAGVIIAPGEVSEYVPVAVAKGKSGADDVVTTQYDGNWVESFGLLKMDFLGLKTLTVLDDALAEIKRNHGVEIDLDAIPLDDPATFELFQRADTVAIFQFESSGMREWLRKLKPTSIDDLIAMNALYRPGPMDLIPNYIARKHGQEDVDFPHEMLKEVLEPTYGIPVYQEQVMKMAQVMGGYSLGGADLLRRAMGKKKQSEMDKQRGIFVTGALDRGVDEKTANDVFDMMAKFASYGFNKCVVGSTEIHDADTGRRTTVAQLFAQKRPMRIHALGEDGKLRPRRVEDVVWNGVKPVFELRTRLGNRIVATGNHPFKTFGGWTNLEDLEPGTRIAAPRRLSFGAEESWSDHELIALGGLLSEGNTCHPTTLYFYNNDLAACEDFAQSAEQFPNSIARIYHRGDGRHEVAVNTGKGGRFHAGQVPWNKHGVAVRKRVRSGAFLWAEGLGLIGATARDKRVPDGVFRLCDDNIALLLGRMWAGDGYIYGKSSATPYYATSSRQLAEDVQHLLLRLGMLSRVSVKRFKYRGGKRTGYTVHLLGTGTLRRFLDRVAPHIVCRDAQVAALEDYVASTDRDSTASDTLPREVRDWVAAERETAGWTWKELGRRAGASVREFYGSGSSGKRGFRRSTVERFAWALGSQRLLDAARSDIYWDEVVSITPLGEQDTYDLTVEQDHNFVADGLIVHNSHSAAYSVVAYQTAYLKANYPAEFMAAALTNEMSDTKKLSVVLDEARHLEIEILPPSINKSLAQFTVENGAVRFGLGAIKGAGLGAIECIIEAREEEEAFTSLFHLSESVDPRTVNKKALESLIRAGALDELEGHRAQLIEALDGAIQHAHKVQADKAAGQNSLFGPAGGDGSVLMPPQLPVIDPWPKGRTLKEEREVIGFYVSGHPLEAVLPEIRAFASTRVADIPGLLADAPPREDERGYTRGPTHTLCGIVTDVNHRRTKTGKPMLTATIEDFTGQAELVAFSNSYDRVQRYLEPDQIVFARGEVEMRGGAVKMVVQDATPIWKVRDSMVKSVVLHVNPYDLDEDSVEELHKLADAHRGHAKLYFAVALPGMAEPQRILSRTCVIEPNGEFMKGLARIVGRDAVQVEGDKA